MTAHLTLEDVYRPLVEGLAGGHVRNAPVRMSVRCGIGQCGAAIGSVVATPPGLAWVPSSEGSADLPGGVPMLLPTTTSAKRQGHCDMLHTSCTAGHLWTLTTAELTSRAKVQSEYRVKRAVPKSWGPLVEDPDLWTDQELSEAVRTLALIATGQWPGDSDLSGMARSKAEARAHRLGREIAGPSVATEEEHTRLVARLAAVLGVVTDTEHNA